MMAKHFIIEIDFSLNRKQNETRFLVSFVLYANQMPTESFGWAHYYYDIANEQQNERQNVIFDIFQIGYG